MARMDACFVWAVCFCFCFCAAGCGSSSPQELSDADLPAHTTNREGVAYPTENIGSTPGKIAPNLAFSGYPDSNRDGGLKPVSFADYYDPTAAHHKLLYLSAAASWCARCADEAREMTRLMPAFAPKGVVMIEVLVAGTTSGYGPSGAELDGWVDQHHTTWTVLADVRGRRVGGQLGLAGVPSSMLIDARTMQIIHQSAGAPDDLSAYLSLGLDWIAKHPR